MSVYIPGMEMPTSCFYCPFRRKVDPENIRCIVTRELFEETFAGTIETRNRGNCPLVPVPPHGRLIDADALAEHKFVCVPHVTIDGKEAGYAYRLGWNAAIEAIIENAETIIKGDE